MPLRGFNDFNLQHGVLRSIFNVHDNLENESIHIPAQGPFPRMFHVPALRSRGTVPRSETLFRIATAVREIFCGWGFFTSLHRVCSHPISPLTSPSELHKLNHAARLNKEI